MEFPERCYQHNLPQTDHHSQLGTLGIQGRMASSFPIWSGLVCRSYLLPGRDAADAFGDLPFHRSSVFGYLFKFGAYALGDGMTETGHYVKIFTYPLGFSRKGVVRGHHQIRRQERVDRYSIGESFDRASNLPGSAETFGQAPIRSHPPCRGEHPPVRKAGRQITVKAPGQIQAGSGPPRTGETPHQTVGHPPL